MSKAKKPTSADLTRQITELTEALQHERADALNLRRRTDEERLKMGAYYKILVVRDLLPVIDNLERALRHVPKDLDKHDYIKGIEAVVSQFDKTLNVLGVNRIKTVGEIFDPKLHEAVSMEEGEGTKEVIIEELQAGYTLGDEVIRHAMVKVKLQ